MTSAQSAACESWTRSVGVFRGCGRATPRWVVGGRAANHPPLPTSRPPTASS